MIKYFQKVWMVLFRGPRQHTDHLGNAVKELIDTL